MPACPVILGRRRRDDPTVLQGRRAHGCRSAGKDPPEILKRTGAYHANDHILLPSGQHTSEYIEKTRHHRSLVHRGASARSSPSTSRPGPSTSCSDGSRRPHPLALCSPGTSVTAHADVRHLGISAGKRRVTLPVEFHRLIRQASKVWIVEDLISWHHVRCSPSSSRASAARSSESAPWRRTKKARSTAKRSSAS